MMTPTLPEACLTCLYDAAMSHQCALGRLQLAFYYLSLAIHEKQRTSSLEQLEGISVAMHLMSSCVDSE